MEIGNFFTYFFNQLLCLFSWYFNTLDSITIYGVSLLDFFITSFIIVSLILVVMNMAPNGFANSISLSHKIIESKRRESNSNRSKGGD